MVSGAATSIDHTDQELFAQLDGLIDALADAPVPDRVARRITALTRLVTRLEALLAREVVTFDANVEYTLDRSRSAAGWIARETRMARSDAHRLVRRARQAAQMPVVGPLWLEGLIPTRSVEELTRARKHTKADAEFAGMEARFARTARFERPEQVADEIRQWRDAIEAERTEPAQGDGQDWESRHLHLSELLDGIGVLDGRFGPEDFASLQRALQAEMARQHHADDPRTLAQRRADALSAICRKYLAGQARGSNRPHVMIHVDLDTYLGLHVGLCETDRGVRLSPEAVRRISCDAILNRVVINADGQVVDFGRDVRTFTPAQYRALIAQYPMCGFPECEIVASDCDMHHIHWWEHDGPTDLTNGLPLCWHHHHKLHEGRWTIERTPDGTIHWHQPDGTHHGTTRPRRTPEPIPITRGERAPPDPDTRPPEPELDFCYPELGIHITLALAA